MKPVSAQDVAELGRPQGGVAGPASSSSIFLARLSVFVSARKARISSGVGSVPVTSRRDAAQEGGVVAELRRMDVQEPQLGQDVLVDEVVFCHTGKIAPGFSGVTIRVPMATWPG